MIDEAELSKDVEKALGMEVAKSVVKGNGTRLGNITLAVEMGQVIAGLDEVVASLQTRIQQAQTIKAAVEALRATL